MRLVILNANTSGTVTQMLGRRALEVATGSTDVVALQPDWGPPSVQSWVDAQRSAAAMVDRMASWGEPLDALVMAGFGDVGRQALRELLGPAVVVVDITEAAAMAAQLAGERYGIVTTLAAMAPLIETSLATAGQWSRCVGIASLDLPVLAVGDDPERLAQRFAERAGELVAAGAEAVCLGSAALTPFAQLLSHLVEVPVIDAVAAGVALAEASVRLRVGQGGHQDPT